MPGPDLTLSTAIHDRTSVIHVAGELDLSTVAAFDAELEQSLSAGRIVVDLSECTFLDSSALQSLVRAQRTIRDGGGAIALVVPPRPVRRVIEVAALDRFVPVFETLAEAVTSTI
jgi:anti-anti-sigma factor